MAAHQREKRGRKPLDPALPRQIVARALPGLGVLVTVLTVEVVPGLGEVWP